MGPFMLPPTVRMGGFNYMIGTTHTLTASRDLAGCGLIRWTMRADGGGGGGAAILQDGGGNKIYGSDGERGTSGQLISDRIGKIRPTSSGYVHKGGGPRGDTDVESLGTAVAAGTSGDDGVNPSFLNVTAAAGSGGRGGRYENIPGGTITNYSRTPANVTNPDGINTAGRGGFGASEDSTVNPAYGATSGGASRAWMTIIGHG